MPKRNSEKFLKKNSEIKIPKKNSEKILKSKFLKKNLKKFWKKNSEKKILKKKFWKKILQKQTKHRFTLWSDSDTHSRKEIQIEVTCVSTGRSQTCWPVRVFVVVFLFDYVAGWHTVGFHHSIFLSFFFVLILL